MVKKVPLGIKIISIFYFLIAAFLVLFAWLFSLIGAAQFGVVGDLLLKIPTLGLFLMTLPLAVLLFFLGRGLLKAQKWSRIAVIVFSVLIFINGAINLIFMGELIAINDMVISTLLGSYFLFNKKVKEFF